MKYKNPSPLSHKEKEDLLYEFAVALCEISKPEEALEFIKDMLSEQEAEMLAKRIKIAELLLDGRTYGEIGELLKTGDSTISRVAEWLKLAGDGYRLVITRLKQKRSPQEKGGIKERSDWDKLKRRYPMMFWPQLLLDEIVASASKRHKERLRNTMQELNIKSQLYRQLDKALRTRK